MTPIQTKAQMYELLSTGRLGNAFRIWRSLEELQASGFTGKVGVRLQGKLGQFSLPYTTQLLPEQVPDVVAKLIEAYGLSCIIYEASPDEHILWQGDVTRAFPWGWHVEYSRAKTHMRAAFAIERLIVEGLRAKLLLETTLTPASFSDLEELLEAYPDHVVELTVYDCCVGPITGRNYVCWETRLF